MLKTAFIWILIVTNAQSACRDIYLYPFFECDSIYEARKMTKIYNLVNHQEDFGYSAEEQKNYRDEGELAEVITIENLYIEHEVEVIVDPYKGLGEFNDIEVYEINMDVLKRLKIEE